MMAQMIMKNRKQTVNTGKMFKWDICEKVMRYVPNLKESGTYVKKYVICPKRIEMRDIYQESI